MNSKETAEQLLGKEGLKALSISAEKNKGLYDFFKPRPEVLETFPTPEGVGEVEIHIEIPEFTCLCPITGQPDWAKIIIDYVPNEKCVESKSLKIYKEGYRMYGTFHEACCQMFCTDLVNLLRPKWLRVKGEFTPRGGIPFNPSVEYYCEDDEILIKSSEAESGNSEVSEIPDKQSDSNKDAS